MNKALRAPTSFALAAEESRRDGEMQTALKLLSGGLVTHNYSSANIVSILLTSGTEEKLRQLRQYFTGFPVPRYLVDQLQRTGDISELEARSLLAGNRQKDVLGVKPQVEAGALEDRDNDTTDKDPIEPSSEACAEQTEATGPDASRNFQNELEQLLHKSSKRPDRELIELLASDSAAPDSKPVVSRRLAELLEKQGHLREAIAMYHILPDTDEDLQQHIRMLEQKLEQH
jgi:hypothetical protein